MIKLSTYDDWKHCITVACSIPLTLNYIEERIVALNDSKDHHTQMFVRKWGKAHLAQVIRWFEQAKQEYKS